MRYPENMLAPDETVVFDVHHHPFVLWRPVGLFVVFVTAWFLVLFLLNSNEWIIYGGLVLLLALSLYIAWRVQVWTHTNIVLTNQRLIYQTGVLTRRSREIPLSKINDVSFYQNVLARMFATGDLIVESAGDSGPTPYYFVPTPQKLKMQVAAQIRAAHASGAPVDIEREVANAVEKRQPTSEIAALPPERPPLYSEIVDQIERLDAMRERGTLTPEEFQRAKDALIERLTSEKDLDR